ncbi:MAG: HAD family hydrolase [Dehalococcoidia bacterium]
MKANTDKAVIWDLDGVIVDTAPFHFAAWREVVESRGWNYTEEDFQESFGRRNDDILRSLFEDISPEEIESLSQRKEELFRSLVRNNVKPLPGVLELMERLWEEEFRVALASSAPYENIDLMLSELGIKNRFHSIIGNDEVSRGKPDPEGFLLAAERVVVPANRCIVIEDAPAGVAAAKAGDMKCIAVTKTHPRQALANADLVMDNLKRVSGKDLYRLLAAY